MSETNQNLETPVQQGAFYASLKRNNREIRQDRADVIGRALQLRYKRKIEDIDEEIYQAQTRRENALDLSPSVIGSLNPAKDFDADQFLNDDMNTGIELRNLGIKSNVIRSRYNFLFGNTYEMLEVE